MENLIIKYLSKDITLEERHQLNKWLDEDEVNRKTLEKFELYWAMSSFNFSNPRKEVLEVITRKIELLESPSRNQNTWMTQTTNRMLTYLKYAAVVILVSVLSLVAFLESNNANSIANISYTEKLTMPGQKKTTVLPDGTIVKLNSDSKLIFPTQFVGDKREVVLLGQAFFDVERDETKPFIIKTSDLEVEVLGTSFDVKAYPKESFQHVAVKSGKVKVRSSKSEESVLLIANEASFQHLNGGIQKLDSFDEEVFFGWFDKKIVFKDNNINEVFSTVERWFGVTIKYPRNQELNNKTYTAKFENPTLDQVLGSIAHVYKFQYETNSNVISIVEK